MQGLTFPPMVTKALRASTGRIALTGAGGWIGKAALHMLEDALGEALQERVMLFGAAPRPVMLASGRVLQGHALPEIERLPPGEWLFFHFAFQTRDKVAQQPLEDYIAQNQAITAHVLAAAARVETKGLFMPSSGAVYKKDRSLDEDRSSNPYGALKVEDEKLFSALAASKGFPVVIPRVFNLAGPFINKVEHYALASMILAAQKGGPITIRAPHRVVRSYTHIADMIALSTALMLREGPSQTWLFDTAGEKQVEMDDLAQAVIAALECPGVRVERPPLQGDKEDVYVGEGALFHDHARALGLTLRDLATQIRDTAAYLAAQADRKSAA